MRKIDIATLVQIERHRQFARFRARELAAVDAVNTGKHGKLQAPLEKPTDEKLFEAFTGGESVNYWGQFFSKRLTLDESAGLLMALDPSQVKFAAHVIERKIPAKNWPPFGIAEDLVNAFKDMRGHVEVALKKEDLFADSDGKNGAADLITWATEKGCVADEVLAAWETHNQPEAVEAGQVTATATPDAVQPESAKPDAMEPEPQTAPETPGEKSIAKWLSVTSDYIAGVMKEGRFGTAKELFKALEAKAGHESSPFEKGTGNNRDSLFVRAIHCHVSQKTMQNNWSVIRSLP
jgi:hypothetical protein